MDVLAPPPVASAPTYSTVGTPPRLGTPVPGATGGLPALGGLSVTTNPMAQQLQSAGRGQDTMLVHMTPDEVNSLQGLARANGGSLTINPETGLPEAGFLGKILPVALGALGTAFGIPPVWMGALGAVGGTAVTGSLQKGLMAGLSAYGGGSLAGAAGVAGKLGTVGMDLGLPGAENLAKIGASAASSGAEVGKTAAGVGTAAQNTAAKIAAQSIPQVAPNTPFAQAFAPFARSATPQIAGQAASNIGNIGTALQGAGKAAQTAANAPGFFSNFGQAARAGLPSSGIVSRLAPQVAGMGAVSGVTSALTPTAGGGVSAGDESRDYIYEGPYTLAQRPTTFYNDILNPANAAAGGLGSTAQRQYFPAQRPALLNLAGDVVRPGYYNEALQGRPYNYVGMRLEPEELTKKEQRRQGLLPQRGMFGLPTRLNEGGTVEMQEGGFVMPARETAEFGNGSTDAGHRRLAAMGGIPIKGSGDGVSDSIPARIGGRQEARVADGETYFPPQAVKRLGGTDKLYSMMRKAHESRKRAAVGKDSNLTKGRS